MPSRSRKNSKTPLKSSIPDQSPPSSITPYSERKINEEDTSIALLQEASIKYPSLISKDAFIGRIVEADTKFGSHAARVWLSKSAMVASSLVPGSVVSVSLACRGSSPLASVMDVDVSVDMANDDGTYFALALVFPSPKEYFYLGNGKDCRWNIKVKGRTLIEIDATRWNTNTKVDHTSIITFLTYLIVEHPIVLLGTWRVGYQKDQIHGYGAFEIMGIGDGRNLEFINVVYNWIW